MNNNNPNASSITSTPVTSTPVQPTSTDPTTAGAVASSNSGGSSPLSSSTTVNSMNDLKKKAPQLYNAMMQGIALQICNQMQEEQAQLEQLQQSYNR
jgi:hypothetical protein